MRGSFELERSSEESMETTATQTAATPAQTNVPFRLKAPAVQQVEKVIAEQGFQGYYLTVRIVPSGCSGYGYDLNLVKETREGDQVWEQDGVKIATDAQSIPLLVGTEVDYVTTETGGSGFKFDNPNAKSSCGCGSSFNA